MTTDELISITLITFGVLFGSVAIALVFCPLLFRHGQIVEQKPPPKDYSFLGGKSLDASTLKPKIEQLRHDYTKALRPEQSIIELHTDLLAETRKKLESLPYFRDRIEEHEEKEHIA